MDVLLQFYFSLEIGKTNTEERGHLVRCLLGHTLCNTSPKPAPQEDAHQLHGGALHGAESRGFP